MTSSTLHKLQNRGQTKCSRCHASFEENSIIATSAGNHRYCYKCASEINLVSGDVKKDLHLDESLDNTKNQIKKIAKNIQLEKPTEQLALKIITESFDLSLIPPKNIIGLACAAIYLAVRILNKDSLDAIAEKLPAHLRIIQRNFWTLRYLLLHSPLLEGLSGS